MGPPPPGPDVDSIEASALYDAADHMAALVALEQCNKLLLLAESKQSLIGCCFTLGSLLPLVFGTGVMFSSIIPMRQYTEKTKNHIMHYLCSFTEEGLTRCLGSTADGACSTDVAFLGLDCHHMLCQFFFFLCVCVCAFPEGLDSFCPLR